MVRGKLCTGGGARKIQEHLSLSLSLSIQSDPRGCTCTTALKSPLVFSGAWMKSWYTHELYHLPSIVCLPFSFGSRGRLWWWWWCVCVEPPPHLRHNFVLLLPFSLPPLSLSPPLSSCSFSQGESLQSCCCRWHKLDTTTTKASAAEEARLNSANQAFARDPKMAS